MRLRRKWGIAALAAFVSLVSVCATPGRIARTVPTDARVSELPDQATRCDPSIPIQVDMFPLSRPEVGKTALFQVTVDSLLDPDLVEKSWIEYSVRRRGTRPRETVEQRDGLGRGRQDRIEVGVLIENEARHEVRARYVVQLVNGITIARTAVRWVDLGAEDPPEGMIGRIVNPDGTGIRVYQGETVKE